MRRGAESGRLLGICPHGWVGSARFVALYFIDFVDFRDSVEYGVACSGLSELSFYYYLNRIKRFPVASPHEEHYVKTSESDVHIQHKIWTLTQPTN